MNLYEGIMDPNLFEPWYRGESWEPWRVITMAIECVPMNRKQRRIFDSIAGGRKPPKKRPRIVVLCMGRRSGKSLFEATSGVHAAAFPDHSAYLQPGERATVMLTSVDKKQSRIVRRYVDGFFDRVPMLGAMVTRATEESIDLSNQSSIEINAANFRTIRGFTLARFSAGELAFWRDEESASPDVEAISAAEAGMATVPSAMMLLSSSPYRQRGALWEYCRDYSGKDDDDVLVLWAPTEVMNPTIDRRIIHAAYERDPARAAAEYGAQFRSDIAGLLLEEWLDATTVPGRHELPPAPGFRYHAFADPSGGAKDHFTIGIAHWDGCRAVLDVCRGRRPPFSPASVVHEFAKILNAYGLKTVTGDRYAAEWVVDAFAHEGITYTHADLSRSDLYLEIEPAFATGQVELLDIAQLRLEFQQLERRTAGGGRDRVDHPPGGRDDYSNAAAGALYLARARYTTPVDLSQAVIVQSPTFGMVERVPVEEIPMLSDGEF